MEGLTDQEKLLRWVKAAVWMLGLLLAVICLCAALVVPRLLEAVSHAERTLSSVDELAVTADSALRAAERAADNADKLVADNADAVNQAMEQFNSVDFEALNRAIGDLADVVEPLAKMTNFLSGKK